MSEWHRSELLRLNVDGKVYPFWHDPLFCCCMQKLIISINSTVRPNALLNMHPIKAFHSSGAGGKFTVLNRKLCFNRKLNDFIWSSTNDNGALENIEKRSTSLTALVRTDLGKIKSYGSVRIEKVLHFHYRNFELNFSI